MNGKLDRLLKPSSSSFVSGNYLKTNFISGGKKPTEDEQANQLVKLKLTAEAMVKEEKLSSLEAERAKLSGPIFFSTPTRE